MKEPQNYLPILWTHLGVFKLTAECELNFQIRYDYSHFTTSDENNLLQNFNQLFLHS